MSDHSSGKSPLLYVVLGVSLTLNVVMLLNRVPSETPDAAPAGDVKAKDRGAAKEGGRKGGTKGQDSAAATQAARDDAEPAASADTPIEAPSTDGWTVVHAKVEQSLARTFQINSGEDGDALSSVYTRLFVWDLDLRRDMQAGDSLAVVWRKTPDGLPEIAAASLQSRKLGRNVVAYRWKATGDQFASYWHPDGTEAPLRLVDGPLAQYDQITSLLKDRPTHKGMDFKTPVGTEVTSPRAGTVTRVNWNWGSNGNCIEIRFDDGVLAKFLHLSENRVAEGARVSAGQVVALSGNTGHSTAPHLHYQLDRGDKTVDPLDYHGTVRRSLDADQTAALKRDAAGFETMLSEGAVR